MVMKSTNRRSIGLTAKFFKLENSQMKKEIFASEIIPVKIRTFGRIFILFVTLLSLRSAAQATDPGWPRVVQLGNLSLTIYQPQVDYWHGYTNAHYRCAIAVKGITPQEKFGTVEVDADTVVDQANRTVVIVPIHRQFSFPKTSAADTAALTDAVDKIRPTGQPTVVSLDRVLACLKPDEQKTQPAVDVNLAPPKIFYSSQPSILLMFMGAPEFKPVAKNRTDLMFALNANWDVFYDTPSQKYYLLNGESWLTAPDPKGPWSAAVELPQSLSSLPEGESWNRIRQNIPGKPAGIAPMVFVSSEPAEIIVTQGEPAFTPIPDTHLMRVDNTDSVLFRDTADGKLYFLTAGRWFSAPGLDGPWAAASKDLPADFANIPDNDPSSSVKASVPGTRDAKDAVMLASIPTTTTVSTTSNATLDVTYSGQPDFQPASDSVQYAVNSPYPVFLVGGTYYCCSKGVWYNSPSATGPWAFSTSVPQAIYSIRPSNPFYNVTYVNVQSSTPSTVVYGYTAGYTGSYVASTGVLMFGAGMLAGAALSGGGNYYYPMPAYYSYGCGAVYNYGYGGYYGTSRAAYGPYGGGGYSTAYNPSTGTYSRSAYAYGPNGSASATRSYNPYTGTATASRTVNTPYGSASRGAAYNTQTGARAAGGTVSTPYGSAGRAAGYNPQTGNAAAGGYRSTANGTAAGVTTSRGNSAGAVTTSRGNSAAGWNTANGQGGVAKTQNGDVYAARDGNVYKKDPNGGWSENTGSGWQSASKPESRSSTGASSSSWSQNRSSMESAAQSRSWGNTQSARNESFQRSAGGAGEGWGGGARSGFGGGGGRGRR